MDRLDQSQLSPPDNDLSSLASSIKRWSEELGFQACAICEADPGHHAERYLEWLQQQYHGEMHYMKDRRELRLHPDKLMERSLRVISLRMDYRTSERGEHGALDDSQKAYVAEYARGRDYHKLMRRRLANLCKKISMSYENSAQRPFVDSAPILERAYAELSGIGWIGKNTMLINQDAGSWFFLGEVLTDIPLPCDTATTSSHCGSCTACLEICPTKAFNQAYQLDARKCISYLTIELKGSIPLQFRDAIGNRIFGCDDCQIVCPWNKFSRETTETDFRPRNSLEDSTMLSLFMWSEEDFLQKTEGSPIRRIGYERWLRNLAIGLGNGAGGKAIEKALHEKRDYSAMVREHVDWALSKLERQAC